MIAHLRPAVVLLLLLAALTGIAYPLAITGIAQALMPGAANGSLIERDGRIVGSALIGQSFTDPAYFWPRPSATTAPDPNDPSLSVAAPYNAAASGASNKGPTAADLVERVAAELRALKQGGGSAPVPIDAVTASGSGLDPDISPAYAAFQVPRVAKARALPEADLQRLVEQHIEGRTLGLLGEPRVNVLALNLALDRQAKRR